MIFLLEVKLVGSDWIPRRVLDEGEIHKALDNLVLDQRYFDWRVRRISAKEVEWINAKIAVHWS